MNTYAVAYFFEWKVGELRRKLFFFCKSLIKLSKIHFKLSEEKTQSEIEIAYVWQKLNASFDLNRCNLLFIALC